MQYFLEGLKIGLALAILLGPIFFALIQAGVEQGPKAGTMVGLGIWISDLLFILTVYYGLSYVGQLVKSEAFPLYLGIGGSIILVAFGLGTLLSKPPTLEALSDSTIKAADYWSLWLKGFLINTINPFTVFFWFGAMSPLVIEDDLNKVQVLLFFSGILGTIIFTDLAKVLLAKQIRNRMRQVHLVWLRRISGLALIFFGIVLLIRAWVL